MIEKYWMIALFDDWFILIKFHCCTLRQNKRINVFQSIELVETKDSITSKIKLKPKHKQNNKTLT